MHSETYQRYPADSRVLTVLLSVLVGIGWLTTTFYSVITKTQYKPSTPHGVKQLKGLLGYLQHRPEIPDFDRLPRNGRCWVSRGLGSTLKEIHTHCVATQSAHVSAFTMVIAPNADCMALVAPADRQAFITELVDQSLDDLFEARHMPVPDYAFVQHLRETEDPTAPGRLNPHAHVIVAGTYSDTLTGESKPWYMNKNKREDHLALFWEAAQNQMSTLMSRYVGLDWPERVGQLIAEREAIDRLVQEAAEQDRLNELMQMADSVALQPELLAPDCWGVMSNDMPMRGWLTTRPAQNGHAVGIYWQADDLLAAVDDLFEPLFTEPDAAEAERSRQVLLKAFGADSEHALEHFRGLTEMVLTERARVIEPDEESQPGHNDTDRSFDSFDMDI